MATLIDDAAAPVVVTRTIDVTPEPPDPAAPLTYQPAPLVTTITITADLTDPAAPLDPAPIAVTLGMTTALTLMDVQLNPAPITTAVAVTVTDLAGPYPLGTALLATTVTLAAAMAPDPRVMLDPVPLGLTVAAEVDLSLQVAGHVSPVGMLPARVYRDYDPTLLVLRRAVALSSQLGGFVVGKSKLGRHSPVWQDIPAATVTVNQSYTPDTTTYPTPPPKGPLVCFNTLLVEQETASISLSYWDNPGPLLYPGDRIKLWYAEELLFLGIVDSTSLSYVSDPEARRHGATRRVDFSATAAGMYAVMMGRTVKWEKLPPDETAIKRIRRWVTVNKW